jgi:hypothetical protein
MVRRNRCEILLRNMKLTNYLLATGTYFAHLIALAEATNVSISYHSAVQDATAFAIQVYCASKTIQCICVHTRFSMHIPYLNGNKL